MEITRRGNYGPKLLDVVLLRSILQLECESVCPPSIKLDEAMIGEFEGKYRGQGMKCGRKST